MSHLGMPPGAEAVYRLTVQPAFGAPLRVEVWGAGKQGWFSARCRGVAPLPDLVVPRLRLRGGQWRSLVNHVQQGKFWELSELQPETNFLVFDGSEVALEGQCGESYHRVRRHEALEPGLARTVNFMLQMSTLLERLPAAGGCYLQDVRPATTAGAHLGHTMDVTAEEQR